MSFVIYGRCGTCGLTRLYLVAVPRKTASGQLAPIRCDGCERITVEPTAPPWRLSDSDQRLLRRLRIDAEVVTTS